MTHRKRIQKINLRIAKMMAKIKVLELKKTQIEEDKRISDCTIEFD